MCKTEMHPCLKALLSIDFEMRLPWIINKGGGRKPKLFVREQILLTLVYLHHMPTFQILGVQFGVSESTAHSQFHYWSETLRELLPASLLEQVKKNERDWEWVKEMLEEWELVVDSSEQVRERPKDYQEQKKCYSGKKKNPTRKNQLIVLPNRREIVDVIVGKPEPNSDINLFRERRSEFAVGQRFFGDKGYVGEEQIETPHKKPKKQELTADLKKENKKLSKQRIVVEHRIRLLQIFRVASERFRLSSSRYEQVILAICRLVRLRVGALILPQLKPEDSGV
ncbi:MULTISPECIES: transposase family protein [unclassified Microcoleus]|uniref:transposase family protein n=1 Tax=unclassified Microcoleus TaxID=2642155 RepID=UPI002FD05721